MILLSRRVQNDVNNRGCSHGLRSGTESTKQQIGSIPVSVVSKTVHPSIEVDDFVVRYRELAGCALMIYIDHTRNIYADEIKNYLECEALCNNKSSFSDTEISTAISHP